MTNQEIKDTGLLIKNEQQIGGNTALRVGGVIEGIGYALDNKDAANGYYQATIKGGSISVNAPNFVLGTSGNLRIKMPAAGTTASTLTIGNVNAVQLWYNGAAVSAQNTWEANEIISVFYDGTRFMASNSQGGGGKAEKISYDNSTSGLAATNVQNAVDELSQNVAYYEPLDLSNAIYATNIINGSNQWVSATGASSILIPVTSWQTVHVKGNGNNNGFYYAFLTSSTTTAGNVNNFASGYTSRRHGGGNDEFNITAPNDAHYLWFLWRNSSGSLMPQVFTPSKLGESVEEHIIETTESRKYFNQKEMDSISCYINAETNVWTSSSDGVAFTIPLKQGQSVKVYANPYQAASIAFLNKDESISAGTSADYANNTNGVIGIAVNAVGIYDVYEDCILYILSQTTSNYYRFPIEVDVSGSNNVDLETLEDMALLKPFNYDSIYNPSSTTTIRIYMLYNNPAGKLFTALPNEGYQVAWVGYDANGEAVDSSGWTTGFENYSPSSSVVKVIINCRRDGDANISVQNVKDNIWVECWEDNTSDALQSHTYNREYTGERINLNRTFAFIDAGTFPASVSPTQGMAIYGNYCVQGSSTESGGKTKAELLNMSTRTSVANLLFSHTGYSAIHCNALCFGVETASGGIMPALYVSQWDGEKCCFVYDIQTSGATLLQVIDPSQLTKNGTTFGVGNVDWIIDTDHNWLFALSYTGSGYTGGQIITKFAIPALSDGSIVQLTDADIIDSNYLGAYVIRQDLCYHGNRLYLLFGSPNGYTDQQYVHVVDVFTMNEVSTIPLQFLTTEPEGIEVYDGELVIHLLGGSHLNKLLFN